jgi:hypothetical protein
MFRRNIALSKAELVFALWLAVGITVIAPAPSHAQDQGAQSQDQHPEGGQKPTAKGHQAQPSKETHTQPSKETHEQPSKETHAQSSKETHEQRPQPQAQQNRGAQGRPSYQFRSQDTGRLRQHYQGGFGRIDRSHRPQFARGGYVSRTYWGDFQPVPSSLLVYLPAVPAGYAIGYYDGYVVVYDPTTYLIVAVLDILQ